MGLDYEELEKLKLLLELSLGIELLMLIGEMILTELELDEMM